MAIEDRGIWQANFTFEDNNGKQASTGVAYPGAEAYADVLTSVQALATALDNVSDAALVGYSITRIFSEAGEIAPTPSSEVERKLRITLDAGKFRNVSSVEVPSPVFSLEQDGTDVPLADSIVLTTLLGILEAGQLGPGNGIVTSMGLDITRAHSPVVVHRSRPARR